MKGRPLLILILGMAASSCTVALPLGGVGPGRGRPLTDGELRLGSSLGISPDVAVTLPSIVDEHGNELNRIYSSRSRTTDARAFDPIGVAYGVTDWLDVGASFSRGIHGFVCIVCLEEWTISLSPAVFRYSATEGGGTYGFGLHEGAVTNVNVSSLVSFQPRPLGDLRLELYGGGAINRYSGWLRSRVAHVEGSGTVPSVTSGVRVVRFPGTMRVPSGGSREAVLSVGLELMGAWLRERDAGPAFFPGGRIYLSIGAIVR